MRRSSIGMAVLAASALVGVAPAHAELIVTESNVDTIKKDSKLDDNAPSTLPRTLPRGAVVKAIDPKTGKSYSIVGEGQSTPPIGGSRGAPEPSSPVGISRSLK